MATIDDSSTDRIWLADWRRRVAALYAEVRTIAATDPVAAWDRWREVREQLFREHPQSPVPSDERAAFRAIHFDYDPTLRFELPVEPAPPAAPGALAFSLPNSGPDASALDFARIGRLTIPFADGDRPLAVFWMAGYAGGLFIPFRDATNGHETYAAGRYLIDTAKSADLGGDPLTGRLTIDFNFAFHPSCAFDPRWACPLAPPENRLDLPDPRRRAPHLAGERLTQGYLRPTGPRTVGGPHKIAHRRIIPPCDSSPSLVVRPRSVCSGRATSGSSAGWRPMSKARACWSWTPGRS